MTSKLHEDLKESQDLFEEEIEKRAREIANQELKEEYPICERYHLWDAIVAWRDFILSSSFLRVTKTNYLSRMLKLIESAIINPALKLNTVNEFWLKECIYKINSLSKWSKTTKVSRITCLISFYKFSKTFDPDYTDAYERLRYGYIPTPHEIKHRLVPAFDEIKKRLVFSSAQEIKLIDALDIQKLYQAIRNNNERDAWIIALMLETGCTLDEALDIKKGDISSIRVCIKNFQYIVPLSLIDCLKTLYKESSEYIFTTAKGKRIGRVQVTRNLKKAGREIGLTFDLTPMIFHRFINAILLRDKRSIWEKYLCE